MGITDRKNRLAAILAADAVAYSRLMAAGEHATLDALNAARGVFRQEITSRDGWVVDMAGDSVLAVFETAAGAVGAALAIQRALATIQGDAPEDRRLQFRIGVHMGDVIEMPDGTVYGDGVNVAARLQALAEPGGITVSDAVRGTVKGRVVAFFEDLGAQQVKNIDDPVHVFAVREESAATQAHRASKDPPTSHGAGKLASRHRVVLATSLVALMVIALAFVLHRNRAPSTVSSPGEAIAANAIPAAFSPPAHSIAVLPFANMSGDPKQEYFSDGLSEELLNSLAMIRDLQVAARTSSFFFKGTNTKLAEIGKELNVAAILEGSVRRERNHVRITVELIDTATGFHLWSQSYDRELKNILTLQAEIAMAVTHALQVTLLADAAQAIEIGGTQNPEALDAYLRGSAFLMNEVNKKGDLEAAIALFSEAIRLDPGFAEAYARKAIHLSVSTNFVPESDVREIFKQSRATAEKAVALAPRLGLAHSALATVLNWGFWDFKGAASEYDRAIALSPTNMGILTFAAQFYAEMGRSDDAAAIARRAVVLDPLTARAHIRAARALILAHQYRDAIRELDRALSLDPRRSGPTSLRGEAYLGLGEFEHAREACMLPPVDSDNHVCLAIAYVKLHQLVAAKKELAAVEAELGDRGAYQYAAIDAQFGDIHKALEWIEKAYQLKESDLIALKVDPFLDPLRKEPRFQEIERKLNFPN